MKQFIFVGGTSFSGSTFFDMILANDPNGFSCGEVQSLFRPYWHHHIRPECGCANKQCTIWESTLKQGENNLHLSLSQLLPNVTFAVDSSKDPFWIRSMGRMMQRHNLSVNNILIWKTPLEIAHSFKKRHRLDTWQDHWINYHRLYLSLIDDWRSVKYSEITTNTHTLNNVCDYLQIPYFHGKEKFWEKRHHTLFGNTSATIHLHSTESEHFRNMREGLSFTTTEKEVNINERHKRLHYNTVDDRVLEEMIQQKVKSNKYINDILDVLEKNDISSAEPREKDVENLKLGWSGVQMKRIKGATIVRKVIGKKKWRRV